MSNNFSMFPMRTSSSITPEQVKMIKHGMKKNDVEFKQFDHSVINEGDVVLIVDGDWLAFSTASKEMERFITVTIDDESFKFGKYGDYEDHLKSVGKGAEYLTHEITKGQYNHKDALIFAKASCKKKIKYAIEKTGATKVIIFCGSTGNFRSELPLPKLSKSECSVYKGQRGSEWTPETLPDLKEWLLTNWLSHWAVGLESDDCMVVTKNDLYERGIKVYIRAVDKDFLNETTGGLMVEGHHEEPIYKYGSESDVFGEFYTKSKGTYHKPCGGGEMFLAYQLIQGDDADLYLPSDFMKEFGCLGRFGIKSVEKYLNLFKTRKELWQGVYDFYCKYLPEKMDYVDCFGVTHKDCTPLYFLNLYYQSAQMWKTANYEADVTELLKEVGVEYET